MAFDYTGLTSEFLATGHRSFIGDASGLFHEAHAYGLYDEIDYHTRTNGNAISAISGLADHPLDIVYISKDGRHITVKINPHDNGSSEFKTIVLLLGGGCVDMVAAIAIQNNTEINSDNNGMSARYVSFELLEDNGFVHVHCEHEARALYEDMIEKVGQGLQGLSLSYDKSSQDILLMDSEGKVIDQANITPQVSGVDPSGIVYTEGVQIIKDTKIWSDDYLGPVEFTLGSGYYLDLNSTSVKLREGKIIYNESEHQLEKVDEDPHHYIMNYLGTSYYLFADGVYSDEYKDQKVADYKLTGGDCGFTLGTTIPKLSDYVVTDEQGIDTPKFSNSLVPDDNMPVEVRDVSSTSDPIMVQISGDEADSIDFIWTLKTGTYKVSSSSGSWTVEKDYNGVASDEPEYKDIMSVAVAAARRRFLDDYTTKTQLGSGQINSINGTFVSKDGVDIKTTTDDAHNTVSLNSEGLSFTRDWDSLGGVTISEVPMSDYSTSEAVETIKIGAMSDNSDSVVSLNDSVFVDKSGMVAGAPTMCVVGTVSGNKTSMFCTLGFKLSDTGDDTISIDDLTKSHTTDSLALIEIQGFGNMQGMRSLTPVTVNQHLVGVAAWNSSSIKVDLTIVKSWFASLDADEKGHFIIRVYDTNVTPTDIGDNKLVIGWWTLYGSEPSQDDLGLNSNREYFPEGLDISLNGLILNADNVSYTFKRAFIGGSNDDTNPVGSYVYVFENAAQTYQRALVANKGTVELTSAFPAV